MSLNNLKNNSKFYLDRKTFFIDLFFMYGLYYEDFIAGKKYVTQSTKITYDDIIAFAELTHDFNPLHTDVNYQSSSFKKPVVHGMLAASVASGLVSSLKLTDGTIVALIEQNIKYLKPLFAEEKVKAVMEIVNKTATKNESRGIIEYKYQLVKDNNIIAIEGTSKVMVLKRSFINKDKH